jgi:hypothetical protein
MKRRWIEAVIILATTGALALTGCGGSSYMTPPQKPVTAAITAVQGEVRGGQQPVVGMTIQLYAVGSSTYGSAATPVFATPLTTDSNGTFSFPVPWCPTPDTQNVYLVGTGGDPVAGNVAAGNANNNNNLALMVALGPCSTLNSSTHIHMNELTTVAAVWALAPFMSGNTQSYLNIGATPTNATGLQLAFQAATQVVNTSTGTLPGPLPTGASLPGSGAEVNTLADVLEACINSKGGIANDGITSCGSLFGDAPSASGFPTDTITAAMNIAQNPSRNTTPLFSIASATPTFEPDLGSAPAAFTVAIQYTGNGLNAPTAIAADQQGNVWVANSAGSSVSEFVSNVSTFGTPQLTNVPLGAEPAGIAIDTTGNAWLTANNDSVIEVTPGGSVGTTLTGNGLNAPTSIAIDGGGLIWVVNSGSGANSVSAFTTGGGTVSGSPFTGAGILSPAGIAINGNANANCADCH